MVDQQPPEGKIGEVSHLKNSFSIARPGREGGDLPKTCHLLPSTAILEPQNRYSHFNRCIRSLPLEGVLASLGTRLRAVYGVLSAVNARPKNSGQ